MLGGGGAVLRIAVTVQAVNKFQETQESHNKATQDRSDPNRA